jgi:hypothetical protein
MERRLKDDKLLETVDRLQGRIVERFPDSGLSGVAAELVQVTRESLGRAESIRRPDYLVRFGLFIIVIMAIGGIAWHFYTSPDVKTGFRDLASFLDATKGYGVYLIAMAAFLITLEIRIKRRRALQAVHELRSMAHLIDMHQLSKDPERIGTRDAALMGSGVPMTTEEVSWYLHFCSELLAILNKIGQLYVQDFPDATAEAAVDNCDRLAAGLSNKIWQKIMIIDRIRADCPTPAPVVRDITTPVSG